MLTGVKRWVRFWLPIWGICIVVSIVVSLAALQLKDILERLQ